MSSNSPHPNSLSPHSKPPTSAFQWPIPPSPSTLKPVTASNNDITVKEILDRYNEDPELLKYILTAKSEEDKKKAARDTLKAEEARIQLRQMDLEYAREQSKRQAYGHPYLHPQAAAAAATAAPQPVPATAHPYPYYGLAPVQQQVLARFNYPPQQHPHQQPPPSPSVPYPHSAHPLCPPPPSNNKISPTSPTTLIQEDKKRTRTSISSEDQQISHNKVMEALKAKIRKSNGSPSPLTKKRKALPRPVVVNTTSSSSTSPSPRSAKPILPPIDTNLGRIPKPTTTTTTTEQQAVVNNNSTSYSPSDHILLNTRRARSLSASSSPK